MQIVYAQQPFPESWAKALFLAGPTPRDPEVESWRPAALQYLKEQGYDGVVFVPEPEDGDWPADYNNQADWEKEGLNMADAIVFWIPRDLDTMPAFTTNVEFGRWITSGKVIAGAPPEAPKNRYLKWLQRTESNGYEAFTDTLEATLDKALKKIGMGALRTGGGRKVPLQIWNTQPFQEWHKNLKAAGNRLDDAEQRWVFYMPKLGKVFSWVLWVKVWIESEHRWKENEWMFGRTDISTVVLYHYPSNLPDGLTGITDAQLVLIREFRSPGHTPDGFIHEVPGGSSSKDGENPKQVAAHEVHEETGIIIPADRFQYIGSRQLAGTLSVHKAHAYAAELTAGEMQQAQALAASNAVQGVEEDTERTYVEVVSLRDALKESLLDWSMVGMICQTLLRGD